MIRLIVLASAVVVCGLGLPQTPSRPRYPLGSRILGGEEITIDQVPYQLSFEQLERHICGATIISADWALTTARCTYDVKIKDVRMRSGTDTLEQGGSLHSVVEIIANENYDYFLADYDIALIRVSPPFSFDTNTAAIPLTDTEPSAGSTCFVSGWGTNSSEGGPLTAELRGVEVPILDREVCDQAYENYDGITERMICAGFLEGGKGPCHGDSGGPLQHGGQLVGIISWGAGCGFPGYPGVYTNVAVLRDWVREKSGV